MIYGNPRINNGDGIYNGGGGGSGTFEVDLGGGVSQTLVFPPYLTPVEYIDLSDYTGSNFSIAGPWQFQLDNDDELIAKISYSTSKVTTNNDRAFGSSLSNGYNESNGKIDINARTNKAIVLYYGNIQTQVQNSNFDTENGLYIKYTGSQRRLYVVDTHGNNASYNSNAGYNTPKEGAWSLFGLSRQNPSYPFHGKIYYIVIYNNGFIRSLFVPAREKNRANTQPYFAECVSGVVGINQSEDWSTTGIVFGPDIDLSSEIPRWII